MNQDQKFSTLISLVLMLATASLGWFTLRDQLALPHIKNLRGAGENPVSEQDVVARLWEDPLLAVQTEVARIKSTNVAPAHGPEGFKALVSRKINEGKRVCMLVVPIPGSSFPDDNEWRLRQRYSLIMALAQSGFQPDGDGRHLGYVTLDWLEREQVHSFTNNDYTAFIDYSAFTKNSNAKPLQVPYEWFDSAEPANNLAVLLVWLQTEFLATEPLCRLAYLRDSLMPANAGASHFAGTFFIGPYTSGELVGIVAASTNLETLQHTCTDLLSDALCILSPLATAPDALIGLPATNQWSAARWALDELLRKKLGGGPNWTYFKNFIAPDDQLTDLLARELRLRHINLEKDTDRVLLLTEADTSYGRALPQAFWASVDGLKEGFQSNSSPTATNLANTLSNQERNANSHLIIARYLQGLDAQKGYQEDSRSGAKSIAGKTTAQALEEVLNKQAATPAGDSQLDYSERLAQHLSEGEARGKVKAVGVLGGDVYDKLILLRSLRSRFPEALFFTTDLDARLWHPDHLRFTQNLIVASAYPVTSTNRNTGFRMAPFRNSYQTAVFNASCAALTLAANSRATLASPPAPEIYELGREGPVRLEPASLTGGSGLFVEAWDRACGLAWRHFGALIFFLLGARLAFITLWDFYDHRRLAATSESRDQELTDTGHPVIGRIIRFLFGTMCAFFTFRSFYGPRQVAVTPENSARRFSDIFRARTGWVAWFLLVLGAVSALFAIIFRGAALHPGGEPWSWAEGVSIWPTEMVRLIIIGSVLWMLILAWQRYLRHSRLLEAEFFSNNVPEQLQANQTNSVLAQQVWDEFINRARGPRRYGRAFLGGVAYFLIALSLMLFTGFPFNTQVRGELAHRWDQGLLCASVFCLLILLFYVLDAVWLSATTLEKLAKPFTVWNDRLVRARAREFGVRHDDIEGYLDVQFAAQKTEEAGKLILLPFIIQFFMLVSRNSFFDNWGWPIGLVAILVCNVVLAAIAWWLLRRAAGKVKSAALAKLAANLMVAELDIAKGTAGSPLPEARKLGLLEIKNRITTEYRGAYSKWVQDPALLAMLIPTGLLGVLTVLLQALFG